MLATAPGCVDKVFYSMKDPLVARAGGCDCWSFRRVMASKREALTWILVPAGT